MSAEHSHRWQHRTHAAPSGHWHMADDDTLYDRYVLGTVQACETCSPKETRDDA